MPRPRTTPLQLRDFGSVLSPPPTAYSALLDGTVFEMNEERGPDDRRKLRIEPTEEDPTHALLTEHRNERLVRSVRLPAPAVDVLWPLYQQYVAKAYYGHRAQPRGPLQPLSGFHGVFRTIHALADTMTLSLRRPASTKRRRTRARTTRRS